MVVKYFDQMSTRFNRFIITEAPSIGQLENKFGKFTAASFYFLLLLLLFFGIFVVAVAIFIPI
jgi:hypothetical protein